MSETVYQQSSCTGLRAHTRPSLFNVLLGRPEHGLSTILLLLALNFSIHWYTAHFDIILCCPNTLRKREEIPLSPTPSEHKKQIIAWTLYLEGILSLAFIIIPLLLVFNGLECKEIHSVVFMEPTKNPPTVTCTLIKNNVRHEVSVIIFGITVASISIK